MADPFSTPFDDDLPEELRGALEPDDGLPDDDDDDDFLPHGGGAARALAALTLGAALMGAVFASISTADFVQHLDRDVHAIHCSFLPGAEADLGESGCRTVMMSTYSSFFRTDMWGGFPVSLWALAVFAFLAYRAGHLALRGRPERHETGFLVAATLLPVGMSIIYGYLAVAEVGATCKSCIGIYIASGGAFVFSLLAHLAARRRFDAPAGRTFAVGFFEGVGFVAALTLVYLVMVPAADPAKALAGCGGLVKPDDPNGIMLHMGPVPGGTPMIDVLDPLCPACKAFESRLKGSGFLAGLDRRSVLFPLDSECNWMVGTSLHPGACAVSEAILCAGGRVRGHAGNPAAARRILDWAFELQEGLLVHAKADPKAFRRRLEKEFPEVRGCLGRSRARNKLNKGMRWMVANALPVLTPQAFIGGRAICPEDTDLGLEFTLSEMTRRPGALR
jgi:uncharacterized membrane protein